MVVFVSLSSEHRYKWHEVEVKKVALQQMNGGSLLLRNKYGAKEGKKPFW